VLDYKFLLNVYRFLFCADIGLVVSCFALSRYRYIAPVSVLITGTAILGKINFVSGPQHPHTTVGQDYIIP
jgi:hypothetical protein